MATKNLISEVSSNYSVLGKAKVTDNQIASIERTMPNLTQGCTYVIPAQIFHCKEDARSNTGYSNRAMAYEFDATGKVVAIKTISLSLLRASYFGIVDDSKPMPEIKAELNNAGLYRAVNANYVRPIKNGQPALAIREFDGVKTAVITSPFAFKVDGRVNYWQGEFEEVRTGEWSLNVDDNMNLVLNKRTDYALTCVNASDFMKDCDLAKDAPNMKDYVL